MKLKLISGFASILCAIVTTNSVHAGPPFTINVGPPSALSNFGIERCDQPIPIIEIVVEYNRSATAWFLTDPFGGEVPNTPFCRGMLTERFTGGHGFSGFDFTTQVPVMIDFPDGAAHKSYEIRHHVIDQSYYMNRGDRLEIDVDLDCQKREGKQPYQFNGTLKFFCDASGKLPGVGNHNPFGDRGNGNNDNGATGFGGNGSGDFEDGEYIGNDDGVVPNDGSGRPINDRRGRTIKDRRG